MKLELDKGEQEMFQNSVSVIKDAIKQTYK